MFGSSLIQLFTGRLGPKLNEWSFIVKKLLLLTILVLATSTGVRAEGSQGQRYLQVQGTGTSSKVPDAFSFTLVLQERGPIVSKLNASLNHNLEQIVTFLRNQKVEEKYIQSMQLGLSPWYEHTSEGRVDKGFILTREIRVTHTNLDDYDILIDGVLSRGVSQVQQFQFVSTDAQSGYDEALLEALHNAKAKAQLMSKQMNVTLGDVLTMSESGPINAQPMPVMRLKVAADEFSSSLPGEQQVSASVNITFAIN
jgi:uncharacterized protein YggE